MQLLVPSDIRRTMRRQMVRARKREIGGILMGEEVSIQRFRIVDFSVDAESGTSGHFVRDADYHERELHAFFQRTGANYRRFNYLGEWHTHPSFDVQPSLQDIHSMQGLVDSSRDVDFAVLLIARVKWLWCFQCSASLFVRQRAPTEIEVLFEHKEK